MWRSVGYLEIALLDYRPVVINPTVVERAISEAMNEVRNFRSFDFRLRFLEPPMWSIGNPIPLPKNF